MIFLLNMLPTIPIPYYQKFIKSVLCGVVMVLLWHWRMGWVIFRLVAVAILAVLMKACNETGDGPRTS